MLHFSTCIWIITCFMNINNVVLKLYLFISFQFKLFLQTIKITMWCKKKKYDNCRVFQSSDVIGWRGIPPPPPRKIKEFRISNLKMDYYLNNIDCQVFYKLEKKTSSKYVYFHMIFGGMRIELEKKNIFYRRLHSFSENMSA